MDCVHRPQNAQSATVVLVAELVATRREERPLWICAPMIHSTAIALSPSPTERALVQVAPHPKCPTAGPRLEKEICVTESENGGLALHQANGLGRKRNLRHNTSHKRNLRHNTSQTQADGRWGTDRDRRTGWKIDTRAEMRDQGQGQSQRRAVVRLCQADGEWWAD